MQISPDVYEIEHSVSNSFLLVDEGRLTLIDTGMSRSAAHILQFIERLNYRPTDIENILLTHADIDHVRGLKVLKAASGAAVSASPYESQALRDGKPPRPLKMRGLMKLVMNLVNLFVKVPKFEVDVELQPGQVLPILGGLEVIPTPGHTPGHISFYLRKPRILFAGDSLRSIDDVLIISRGVNTWDEYKAEKSGGLQAKLRPKVVCVGHGSPVFEAEKKVPKRYS